MKKLLSILFTLLLVPFLALAQDNISQSTGIIGNGRLLGAKTYDSQTTVGVLGVDSSGNTTVQSLSGKTVQFPGAVDITGAIGTGSLTIKAAGDSNRLHVFAGASDTALTYKFGDGGTTAVQQLTISASTADADDDSTLFLAGGGAVASDGSRGAYIQLPGEEVAGGSDITYNAGIGDTHIFQIAGTTELTLSDDTLTFTGAAAKVVPGATSFTFRDTGNANDNFSILDAGTATLRSDLTMTGGVISFSGTDKGIFGAAGKRVLLYGGSSATSSHASLALNSQTFSGAGGSLDLVTGSVASSTLTIAQVGASGNINFATNAYATTRWTMDAAAGNLTSNATNGGDLVFAKSGNSISVQEATASTACMGVATPNGVTPVTVTTSCAVSGARVFFSRVGSVTNMASISVTTNPSGTGFAFASTGAADTLASSVVYLIVKESA